MEINNLVGSDSGDYKVVAKNKHGEADSNIKLNIESKRAERLPEGIAPHFVSKPKVTQTQESLLIQLELEANPTPSASWYLDNRDLGEMDSRFKTTIERKSADNYLLSMEIQVCLKHQQNWRLNLSPFYFFRIQKIKMLVSIDQW